MTPRDDPQASSDDAYAQPLTADLPCGGCRYNLRGLRPDGRCPECGAPVKRSFLHARSAQGRWVERTCGGAATVLVGFCGIVAVFAAFALRSFLASMSLLPYGLFWDLVSFAFIPFALSAVSGLVAMCPTAHCPGALRKSSRRVRTLLATLPGFLFLLACITSRTPAHYLMMLERLSLLGVALVFGFFAALSSHIALLADRARADRLREFARIIRVVLLGLVGVVVLAVALPELEDVVKLSSMLLMVIVLGELFALWRVLRRPEARAMLIEFAHSAECPSGF